MIGAIATATEMQNNFGRYLKMIMNGDEVIITKNGKVVGRMIPQEKAVESLTSSMIGMFKGSDVDDHKAEIERALKEKHGIDD